MSVQYLCKYPQTVPPYDGDTQAHRLFRLEADLCGHSIATTTTDKHLREVLVRACNTWKVPKPELIYESIRNTNFGWQTDKGIHLNTKSDGANMQTMIHELAHWICHKREYAIEDHGPEFMWVYIELLEQFNMMPRECMMLLCKNYMVEVG